MMRTRRKARSRSPPPRAVPCRIAKYAKEKHRGIPQTSPAPLGAGWLEGGWGAVVSGRRRTTLLPPRSERSGEGSRGAVGVFLCVLCGTTGNSPGRRASRTRLAARPHHTPPRALLYCAAAYGPAGPWPPQSGSRARSDSQRPLFVSLQCSSLSRTPVTALIITATATALPQQHLTFLLIENGGACRAPPDPPRPATAGPFPLPGLVASCGGRRPGFAQTRQTLYRSASRRA